MSYSYVRDIPVSRAQTIQKLIQAKSLTQDGADWLTLRMDPFHDFNRPIAGYPDADNIDTIVSAVNFQTVITKPAASAGNWDMHLFTLPFTQDEVTLGTSVDGVFTASAGTYLLGLVNVAKADAGEALFPDVNPVVSANFEMAGIDGFDQVGEGVSRIIGMGIEIIDSTAELYKQGNLLCYKMPGSHSDKTKFRYIQTDAKFGETNPMFYPSPPADASEAAIYRNAVQWQAKDGAYITCGQEGVGNPFTQRTKQSYVVGKDPSMVGTDVVLHTSQTTSAGVAAPNVSVLIPGYPKTMNLTQHGCILSGLNNNASITVRVRIFVERAPLMSELALVPLASPSAAYDVRALQLYSHLISELPCAVPVGFNAAGDWWKWIVKTIRKVAPALGGVLTPILGPEAGLIGTAVGAVADAIPIGDKKKEPRRRRNRPSRPIGPRLKS